MYCQKCNVKLISKIERIEIKEKFDNVAIIEISIRGICKKCQMTYGEVRFKTIEVLD